MLVLFEEFKDLNLIRKKATHVADVRRSPN